jgi:hypothetical protein
MNPNHPSPDDPGQRTDAAVDLQQLAKIEQQLRRMQPRPPELDVEAIVCAARTVDQPVLLAERPSQQHGTQTHSWVGVIAGSWACGAMAGALVTFVLLSRGAPPETSAHVTTTLSEELPQVAETETGAVENADAKLTGQDDSPQSDPPWSRTESRIFAMLLDPYSSDGSPYAEGWRPLRVGAIAFRQAPEGAWGFRPVTDARPQNWVDTPAPSSDAQQDMTTHPAPARITTREELLRELLGAKPESVL